MNPLDLDRFRYPPPQQAPKPPKRNPPSKRKRSWFIKGPIFGPWISRAAHLPGKSLNVALAICYLHGLQKSQTVKLTRATLERFNVKPDATRRALSALESAALITVQRQPGHAPVITFHPE